MNKGIRRMSVLLCCICTLLLGSNGCSQTSDTTNKPYVAVIAKSTSSAFWKSVQAGANAACTEYNLHMTFDGPAMEEDYLAQNQIIDQAVADGADAIVLSAVDFNANADAIDAAAKAGVKIVVIDSDVNSSQVSSRIGTDNFAAGQMAGNAALASNDETLHIGIVNYDVNSANGQQREAGFRDRISSDPRVGNVYVINVVSTTEDARAGTVELLLQHQEINVVATFNEWTSLGVGWAIRDLNLQEQTQVVAFDSNVVSVGMLETGEVDALIVQNPYAMGYLGIETAYQLLGNRSKPEKQVDTATTLITRENMFDDDYQRILFSTE